MPSPATEEVGDSPARSAIAGYRLLRRRSKGAVGALHLATDEKGAPSLVRLVSRALDAKTHERIVDDLGVLEDVVSPNVVPLLTHGRDDGQTYYALEDPGGASLLDLVRTCRPLDESELAWIGRGLSRGLAALHRVNLPHGNLVPANVAVLPQGPKVVDLGWGPRLGGSGPTTADDMRSLGELLAFAASGVRPPPPDKPFDLRKRIPWLSPPVVHLLEALLGPGEDRPKAKQAAKQFEELATNLQVPGSAPLPSVVALLAKVPDERGRPTASGSGSGSGSGLMESSWELEGTPSLRPGGAILLRPGLELTVERLLGQGGMGVVYLLRDAQLGRLAALKLVRGKNETRIRRFHRETSVTARLDHPGIPPVYEAGRTPGGEDYLLMRYVEGSSLRQLLDRIERKGGTNADETRNLLGAMVKVGEALGYAHSRGIVHRDLKPDNIMIGAHGEVFVMDWGLARNLGESAQEDAIIATEFATKVDPGSKLTHDGAFLGTPGYVAPEQFRREEVDGRADVFAMGAVLSEILTGRPPFASDDTLEVLASTNEGRVELPNERDPSIPQEFNAIVAKALAADKAYRYTSAEALISDLRAYLEGREVSVYQRSTSAQLLRLLRRHYIFFAFQGLVLLTLVSAGIFVTKAGTEASAARQASDEREQELSAKAAAKLKADEAARRVEINGLVAAGQKALGDGQVDVANEYFVKALALDPQHLEANLGKREAESHKERAQAESLARRDRSSAERLIAEGAALREEGDLAAARRAFVQALGFDGTSEEAQQGLLDVDRIVRDRKEARATAARTDRAKKLLRRAQATIETCHAQIKAQEDPRTIQEGYLAAMADLERALRLVPYPAAERLRVEAAQELYTVLKDEGQAELADFVLRTQGVEKPAPGAVTLERDPHLVVEETDAVLIRRAFASAVHFLPTAAFNDLRDYLARLGKGRFRALVGIRSRVTDSIPPNVLATGIWIRLEDKSTRGITPTLKIEFERPFRRGIRLDQHRRVVAPFDRTNPQEAKAYIQKVEAEIKRLVKEAVNRKG